MAKDILYLGDTSLSGAASYLAGCLHRAGRSFDYLPSDRPLTSAEVQEPHQLYIISDYPEAMLEKKLQQRIVQHVQDGANLLMIGGWESFHGMGGDWNGTPLGELLPVHIASVDDRQNCDSPVFLKAQVQHAILADLPWSERPPLIGGYNKVTPKDDAQVLLTAERFQARLNDDVYVLTSSISDPLLVVAEQGNSRRAALMTDLAPHWVGPLVDWGAARVAGQAPQAEAVEVGNLYFQFVQQLIAWVGQYPTS